MPCSQTANAWNGVGGRDWGARYIDIDLSAQHARFFDENGEELPMKVGKTFIQIVDNEQPVVVVADEAVSGSIEPQKQRSTVGTGKKKK